MIHGSNAVMKTFEDIITLLRVQLSRDGLSTPADPG